MAWLRPHGDETLTGMSAHGGGSASHWAAGRPALRWVWGPRAVLDAGEWEKRAGDGAIARWPPAQLLLSTLKLQGLPEQWRGSGVFSESPERDAHATCVRSGALSIEPVDPNADMVKGLGVLPTGSTLVVQPTQAASRGKPSRRAFRPRLVLASPAVPPTALPSGSIVPAVSRRAHPCGRVLSTNRCLIIHL